MTEGQLIELVTTAANEIHDPCSMARGLNFGLIDMGLVRHVKAEQSPEGWAVTVRVRLTAPGCLFMGYFEEQLKTRVARLSDIHALIIEWDDAFDWTPDSLSDAARAKMDEYRDRLERHWATKAHNTNGRTEE